MNPDDGQWEDFDIDDIDDDINESSSLFAARREHQDDENEDLEHINAPDEIKESPQDISTPDEIKESIGETNNEPESISDIDDVPLPAFGSLAAGTRPDAANHSVFDQLNNDPDDLYEEEIEEEKPHLDEEDQTEKSQKDTLSEKIKAYNSENNNEEDRKEEEKEEEKPRKLSLREKIAQARDLDKGNKEDKTENPKAIKETVSADTPDHAINEEPRKLSLREKLAQAKKSSQDTSNEPVLTEDGPPSGILGFISSRIAMAKSVDSKQAGVDISEPTRKEKRHAHKSQESKPVVTTSAFQELLVPLPSADLKKLQLEAQQEVPLFVQIRRTRRLLTWAAYSGWVFGLLALLGFAASVGKNYLTNTLTSIPIPTWIPLDDVSWLPTSPADLAGGVLFGLGLLLPVLAAFIIGEGVTLLARAVLLPSLPDAIVCAIALACGLSILIACSTGSVFIALLLVGVFVVARAALRAWGSR